MAYHHPERIRVLRELTMLVQEKDAAGDDVAVAVLAWAYNKLVGNPTDPKKYEETSE